MNKLRLDIRFALVGWRWEVEGETWCVGLPMVRVARLRENIVLQYIFNWHS